MNLPLGTLFNTATVIVGSLIGIFLHKRFPQKVQEIVFQGLGLTTLVIGFQMAQKTTNILTLIFAILIGGIIGELLHIEDRFETLSNWLKKTVKSDNAHFTQGLITAFILFCVGPMTILGTINEGLRADHTLLILKGLMDGFASIALASTYGIGVLFSAIPLFIYQTALTLFSVYLQQLFTATVIAQLTGTGGVLMLGIGFNMLEIKKIRVANLLPALVIIVMLAIFIK